MKSTLRKTTTDLVIRAGWLPAVALTLVCFPHPATAEDAVTRTADADTSLILSGDQEGTVFKSLTVEGENKVQITFDRPELVIDLDPSLAPGLTWGSSLDVLNRTIPDLDTPLLATSVGFRSPYVIRPYVMAFETGPVATFHSDLESVHRWSLLVVDSRGREVVQFQGKKNPPKRIEWDGRRQDGSLALPGLTYSYVLEAFDKAGNKRRFVGDGFELEAYRRDFGDVPEFLVSGTQWTEAARLARPGASAFLLETASWLNMKTGDGDPVVITATAASYGEAKALGDQVARQLRPLLPGNDARVAVAAVAEPGTPPGGILHIRAGMPETGED